MQSSIQQLKQRLSYFSEMADQSQLSLNDVREIKSEMELALAELNQVTDKYREE